jgi:integrase
MMKRTKNYAEEILAELRHTHREIAHLRQEVSELKRALAASSSASPTASPNPQAQDFLALATTYCTRYAKSDRRMVLAMLRHLHAFAGTPPFPLASLTKARCREFQEYLYARLRGNTPAEYFKKFRKLLLRLVDDGLLGADPTAGIRLPQSNEVTKSILTDAELERLAATAARHPAVKRAFLFACYTGLRRCDISLLTYSQLDASARRLTLRQQKVAVHSSRSVLHLNLSATALRLIGPVPPGASGPIFPLPGATTIRRALDEWVRAAGITKHITFHCARHTFITRLMAHGANIATTASLAGHSTTRHTEKYIHIVDELKQKAVDSLPPLGEIV